MKKRVTVKRQHRVNKQRDILFQGFCEFHKTSEYSSLHYEETTEETAVHVEVICYPDHMELKRQGETSSTLLFIKGKRTKGVLSSAYGDMDIDLDTIQYICKDSTITLEYDIISGEEVVNGYRIIWNIKEA